MITTIKNELTRRNGGQKFAVKELRGLSTDTKPTIISGEYVDNGSIFIEIDTGKIFFYDLSTQSWKGAE